MSYLKLRLSYCYTVHCTNLHFDQICATERFQFSTQCKRGGLLCQEMDVQNEILFLCLCERGLTCIQVELYESEGQSYELCRSEKNPADNKNRLLKHSYTAPHRLTESIGAEVSRPNSYCASPSACFQFNILNVSHTR